MVTLRYEIYLMGLIVVFYLSCCQNIVLLLKWSFSCDLTITTSSLFFKLVWTYWVFKFCDHCSWWKGIIVIFQSHVILQGRYHQYVSDYSKLLFRYAEKSRDFTLMTFSSILHITLNLIDVSYKSYCSTFYDHNPCWKGFITFDQSQMILQWWHHR